VVYLEIATCVVFVVIAILGHLLDLASKPVVSFSDIPSNSEKDGYSDASTPKSSGQQVPPSHPRVHAFKVTRLHRFILIAE